MTAENRSREAHANSLQCERDVWLLLEWLYADRRDSYERRAALREAAGESGDNNAQLDANSNARTKSRRDVMLRALSADDELRELSIVVRWLERTFDAALAPPAPLTASWHGTVRTLTERRLASSTSTSSTTTAAAGGTGAGGATKMNNLIELDIDAPYRTASLNATNTTITSSSTLTSTKPSSLIGIGRSTISSLIPTTTTSSSAVPATTTTTVAATTISLTNVLDRGDASDEAQLHRELWRLVRGGRIAAAQQLARNAKQPWRATALGGGLLHHDARRKRQHRRRRRRLNDNDIIDDDDLIDDNDDNYDDDDDVVGEYDDGGGRHGNLTRQAWKAACWALVRASGGDTHERATFAALCGSLSGMLPACSDWRDYAWAYLRALLERRADAHLVAQPDFAIAALSSLVHTDSTESANNADDEFDEPEERVEGEVEIARAAYEAVRDADVAPPPTIGDCLRALRHGSMPAAVRGSLATTLSSETRSDAEAYRRIATMAIEHVGMDQLLCTLARWLSPAKNQTDTNTDTNDDDRDIVPTRQLARFAAHCSLFFNAVDASNSDVATHTACHSLLVNSNSIFVPCCFVNLQKTNIVELYRSFGYVVD